MAIRIKSSRDKLVLKKTGLQEPVYDKREVIQLLELSVKIRKTDRVII